MNVFEHGWSLLPTIISKAYRKKSSLALSTVSNKTLATHPPRILSENGMCHESLVFNVLLGMVLMGVLRRHR